MPANVPPEDESFSQRFNFFNWHPRVQGFIIGIVLMGAANVIDTLRSSCRTR